MMWKRFLLALISGLTFCGIAGQSSAAPVMMYATGTIIAAFAPSVGGWFPIPGSAGTAFSVYLAYDVANAEFFTTGGSIDNGSQYAEARSASGCVIFDFGNGVCADFGDFGTGTPVVTDYRVSSNGGIYEPFHSWPYGDESGRHNAINGINEVAPGAEQWIAERDQVVWDTHDWPVRRMRRHIFISPLSYENTFLPDPLIDLSQGFNLDLVFDGQQNFNLLDEMITPSCAGCDPIWHGTWLLGTLVTAQFQDGVAKIPEPTTIILLLAGLASLGLTRRASRARYFRSPASQ